MDQRGRKRDRRSKLTEEDVAQIKALLQQGKTPTTLARYFPADRTIIAAIRDKKTYRHIAPAEKAKALSKLFKITGRI
jgi:hypothetical protein